MILRYANKSLLMLAGVPGSGKSTLVDSTKMNADVISADYCRGMVQWRNGHDFDDYVPECITEARELFFDAIGWAMERNANIVAEASYLTSKSRSEMIHVAQDQGYTPHLLVVHASWDAVVSAQYSRKRQVPLPVLQTHWENWKGLEAALQRSDLDPGLASALTINREETDCLDSINFA